MRELLKKLSPKPLIACYKGFRYTIITMLFYVFRLCPIQQNRIVFMNVWGYGDNVKYVAEALLKRKKDYELIFICNHPERQNLPKAFKGLKTNSIKAIKALATASMWVESNRKEAYIKKRNKQYYIQLWHGGLPLKKIEGDCAEYLGASYIKRAKKDSAMTDLYVSNGTFCTQMYRRAFFYEGEIVELGTPRMDLLLSEDRKKKERIKAKLGVKPETKLALYAPTYRDTEDASIYQMDYEHLTHILQQRFGGEFKLIVRLHPLVQAQSSGLAFSEHVIDGNKSRDIYELMFASDVLITDFSNTMFEFSFARRPVFLYAKDLSTYQSERGFYFDYNSLPYVIATSQEQLEEEIMGYEEEKEQAKVFEFFKAIGLKETGHASIDVADLIEKLVDS